MRYQFFLRAFFGLAMLAGSSAYAAVDCDNAMSQDVMEQCATDAFKREDTRLNKLYQQLLARTDAAQDAKLKQIQRAWVGFRDLHCDFEEQRYEGGSMAPMVGLHCRRELTRQRNETLAALIKDFH